MDHTLVNYKIVLHAVQNTSIPKLLHLVSFQIYKSFHRQVKHEREAWVMRASWMCGHREGAVHEMMASRDILRPETIASGPWNLRRMV